MRRAISMLACFLLAACATAPRPAAAPAGQTPAWAAVDPGAAYRQRAAQGTAVYRLDPAASQVRIYAFRGGTAARAGHNHVFSAPRLDAWASLPSDSAADATFDLLLRLDELVVDEPALRAETGDAFAGERSAADREGTLRNMLGPRNLDAAQYPEVRIRALRIEGDWPVLVAQVAIALHGTQQQQDVVLQVRRRETTLEVSGDLAVRQTAFGVAPFSVLGGLMAVQDPVAVRFELSLRRV